MPGQTDPGQVGFQDNHQEVLLADKDRLIQQQLSLTLIPRKIAKLKSILLTSRYCSHKDGNI